MRCKYLLTQLDERLCGLNRHERPTEEECAACKDAGRDSIGGLGDTVARYINKTPLRRLKPKGCGCKRRQERLNELMPAKDSD
jgi:hypothetical protein